MAWARQAISEVLNLLRCQSFINNQSYLLTSL